MKNYIFIIGVILLSGCDLTHKSNSERVQQHSQNIEFKQTKDNDFNTFLLNFKRTKLPLKINPNTLITENLIEFNCKNSTYTDEYSLAYSQIPTKGNFIATITLKKMETYVPVLTTYDLTGQIIDSKLLALDNLEYLSEVDLDEIVSIDKNFNISITDTIYLSDNADVQGIKLIDNENGILQKKGKILDNGIIELK